MSSINQHLRISLMERMGLPMPFEVEWHDGMLVRCTGKVPGTVLALVQMLYIWRICEYTEPLSYGRFWDYETLEAALEGLWKYLLSEGATEPQPLGWCARH